MQGAETFASQNPKAALKCQETGRSARRSAESRLRWNAAKQNVAQDIEKIEPCEMARFRRPMISRSYSAAAKPAVAFGEAGERAFASFGSKARNSRNHGAQVM
jgi:hypothetical protein